MSLENTEDWKQAPENWPILQLRTLLPYLTLPQTHGHSIIITTYKSHNKNTRMGTKFVSCIFANEHIVNNKGLLPKAPCRSGAATLKPGMGSLPTVILNPGGPGTANVNVGCCDVAKVIAAVRFYDKIIFPDEQ